MNLLKLMFAIGLLSVAACVRQAATRPDPRVGLRAGNMDAAEAASNLKILSRTAPAGKFAGSWNSDLAFTGNYAIQGNFNGFQVWDITNPSRPVLKTSYFCPASQSDVSVYKNLLFVSGESHGARLDCGAQGVQDTVSAERLRGLRIFDISDIANPKYIANVQTCRGSHTHTVVEDPKDRENVYVYISGSADVRSPRELPGCSTLFPEQDPNSAYFRIEVVRIPVAAPEKAAVIATARIFEDLVQAPSHGESPADIAAYAKEVAEAKAKGAFTAVVMGQEIIIGPRTTAALLEGIVTARGGTGAPTAADSATLRANAQRLIDARIAAQGPDPFAGRGPTQCHDITVYPAIGLAGGACEGYGFLLDISDVTNPKRIAEVADSNFAYWHSATLNNDGTKILFSDEWGGGTAPKCRVTDKKEWGADAIFTIEDRKMKFQSYYKLPAPQTALENCVAHNGSLIPIPGRDVMVQAWYQGGISVFDWTDAKNPTEIAYFDRGPVDSTRMEVGGTWSAYWYNGAIVSSEIARGLDIAELTPSEFVTQNEIDAAKTVHLDYFNAQGQPKFVWPPSFSLARAYVDQLERSKCLSKDRIAAVRQGLASAETSSGAQRREGLLRLAADLQNDARGSCDAAKIGKVATTARELAGIQP
ncbi:MAG: hypothetical protein WD825_13435 [Gemmatimonadaceae bacterium]